MGLVTSRLPGRYYDINITDSLKLLQCHVLTIQDENFDVVSIPCFKASKHIARYLLQVRNEKQIVVDTLIQLNKSDKFTPDKFDAVMIIKFDPETSTVVKRLVPDPNLSDAKAQLLKNYIVN